jgi:putative FmdB family regulatory protein
MPNYDLKCSSCKHEYSQNLSYKGYDTFKSKGIKCPICGEKTLKIKISALPINFKGDGFYINHSKRKDKK